MPTYDLGLEHVSLAFATKNIFTDVTQGVFEGDRIGIVGKNGDGKSTLLHLFKGTQEPDSGRVTMRNGLTFGMLDQRDPLDDNATVREAALEGREDYEWAAETKSREIVEALLGGISLDGGSHYRSHSLYVCFDVSRILAVSGNRLRCGVRRNELRRLCKRNLAVSILCGGLQSFFQRNFVFNEICRRGVGNFFLFDLNVDLNLLFAA